MSRDNREADPEEDQLDDRPAEAEAADWRNFYDARGYHTLGVRPFCLRGKPVVNPKSPRCEYID